MAQGCSVRLGGIGSFYFTAATNNNGVATEKEVTAALINSVRVRFIPETRFRGGGTRGGAQVAAAVPCVDWRLWTSSGRNGKARWIRIIQTQHRAMT